VKDRTLEARVQLVDVGHLFRASDDPFHPDYDASGTLEQLAYDLYTRTSYRAVKLTLEVPATAATPDAAARLREGIGRYCERQIREYDRTRVGERSRAFLALGAALVALAIFVGINRAVRDDGSFWTELFTEGITVAFWVAVWFPLDSLVFGQWQHRLDTRIYDALRDMELTVVAHPE
jgi:hypothetical protein